MAGQRIYSEPFPGILQHNACSFYKRSFRTLHSDQMIINRAFTENLYIRRKQAGVRKPYRTTTISLNPVNAPAMIL